MRRQVLVRLVKGMFTLLGLAFIYVLFRGLGGIGGDPRPAPADFSNIAPGQTVAARVGGQTVWLSRLTERQKLELLQLEPYLVSTTVGCDRAQEYCLLSASGLRDGIQLSYSKQAPPQLPYQAAWYGGFVDPSSGAIFDLLGRPYRLGRDSDQQTLRVVNMP